MRHQTGNTTNKALFIALSTTSTICLISSFGFPLQRLELYRQTELSAFRVPTQKTYILTENDRDYPWGFDKARARKIGQIHHPATLQKVLLLCTAIACSAGALLVGKELVPQSEYEAEIEQLAHEGRKELKLKEIKQRFALANKSSQLLFLDQMKALMEEFGSPEEDMLEVDELNALYDSTEQSILPTEEPPVENVQQDESFRERFPSAMDNTSLKTILKALGEGHSREVVIQDVLGGGEAATHYYQYLLKNLT